MRGAADTAWHGQTAYGRRDGFWQRIGAGFAAVARLILPVLTLLVSFAAVYLYQDTKLPPLVDGMGGLTVGHALVPFCFLAVHMTNRRFGPSYAFAQVVVGLALVVAFVVFAARDIAAVMPFKIVPELRVAIAAASAFFAASFVSIVVFDGTRGPRWWTAPLFGFLIGGILFALIFMPAAYAGVGAFARPMLVYAGLLAGAGILMLLPYWMLRGIVRPMSGFGGY
jgi:uncharacterized PurR-regulated membrane protein YhhQ (DUF165 family)